MATEVDPLVQKMRDRNGQYMLNLVGTSGATVEEFRRRLKDTHIDYQNDTGIGALWASCWHAAPAIARACLDAGATVDLRSTTGVTPLMMACSAGNVEIVQMLLDHGAYVDEVTPDGHTALTNGLNHPEVVKLLLERGANRAIKVDGKTPLELAREVNGINIYAKTRAVSAQILREAEQIDMLKEVEARRALLPQDPTLGPKLYDACRNGQFDEAARLIRGDGDGATGASVAWADAEHGRCALWGACRMGRVACARLLLANNALVDQVDNDGVTPLLVACQHGHTDCALLCLDHGARINALSKKSFTPLLSAVYNRHASLATTLLERGAARDPKVSGKTALEWARAVAKASPGRDELRSLVAALEAADKDEQEAMTSVASMMGSQRAQAGLQKIPSA